MSYDEYHQKKVALIRSYLHLAVAAEARREEVDRLAPELAHKLDALALEIDPFAPGTGKSGSLLGGPGSGGSR